jgi:hypothetical protein
MNTVNNEAVLIAHCGTRKITREELRELPVPEATRTHQPLSHLAIVESLVEALSFRYLTVVRDEYAISPDGMKMFGVMDLSAEFQGCRFSIGLRNSNDKSMRLALTAGLRVTVCDNMMFSGDFSPLLHKHTRKLELLDAISVAVDRIQRSFAPLERQIADWQETVLMDEQVKLIIYEAFLDKRLKVPKHLMTLVHNHYFKPDEEAFKERTFWSLSNAFTSSFKKLLPVQHFAATAKLGTFLSEVYDRLPEETLEQIYGGARNADENRWFRPYLVGAPLSDGNMENGDTPNDETLADEPDDDELREVLDELENEFVGEADEFAELFDEPDESGFQTAEEVPAEIAETISDAISDTLTEAIIEDESKDEPSKTTIVSRAGAGKTSVKKPLKRKSAKAKAKLAA